MTVNQFIEDAKRVHGEKYDYSKVSNCTKVRDKVIIICPVHGEFQQDYLHHVQRSCNCKKCADIEKGLQSRMTLSDFIEKASKVHNNKYNYDKVDYISSKDKIIITCPIHGDFIQAPNLHLFGEGCPKCKKEKISEISKYDTSTFIKKCKEIYGDIYTYENTIYTDSRSPVIITCPIHGDFQITASSFLNRKKGCTYCANEKYNERRKISFDEFVNRARFVHGDLYTYEKDSYKNLISKTNIYCKKHGSFYQTGINHIKGEGCPICNYSKLELEIRNVLIKNNIIFEQQKTFEWLKDIGLLKYDFYLPEFNIAVECQGIQHFKCLNFFGGKTAFEKRIYQDNLKKKLSKEHNIEIVYYSNITDIEFPYFVFTDKEKLIDYIKQK